MNFLAWLLSLTLLVALSYESVLFYKATVCRQKAWLKGSELKTRALLHKVPEHDRAVDLGCRLYVTRSKAEITWRRLPNPTPHPFHLHLKGRL